MGVSAETVPAYGCLVRVQVVLAVQLVLCLSCASASLHWRQAQGFSRYHLALGNFTEGAQFGRLLRQRTRYHVACTPISMRKPLCPLRRQAIETPGLQNPKP